MTSSPMRWLICGGRRFFDKARLYKELDHLTVELGRPECVIEGGASGADALAAQWATDRNIPLQTYGADWARHGRRAGFIRNARMLTEGKPTHVFAFPGGIGTEDMIRKAEFHSTKPLIKRL